MCDRRSTPSRALLHGRTAYERPHGDHKIGRIHLGQRIHPRQDTTVRDILDMSRSWYAQRVTPLGRASCDGQTRASRTIEWCSDAWRAC